MTSRVLLVIVLALAGLALAAGVTFAASRLVGQPIGLSEDQRSLEDSLAPPRTVTVTRSITKAEPAPVKKDESGGDGEHGDDDDD